VKLGAATFFPDIMLTDGKKLTGLVEVETGESVNNLEAMSQWVHFAKARVPFHLYVPVQSFEVARRLCQAYGAKVSELWTYRPTHDGFDLVRMVHDPTAPGAAVVAAAAAAAAAAGRAGGRKPAVKPPATKKAPAAKKAAARKPAKAPAKKAPARKPAVKAKAAPKARKAARKR
jgi:pyruvate/2-oxoglutarate dehydrogenase complex dihydrolipoamide acyltransferase (E2) component